MKNEIQEHYREEDVQKMKLHSDIENWNAALSFIQKEIAFFTSLLESPRFATSQNQKNTDQLLQDLKTIAESNKNYTAAVLNFNNTLDGLNECEDLQCETYFLNSHEELREQLKKHEQTFRNLKENIFSYL